MPARQRQHVIAPNQTHPLADLPASQAAPGAGGAAPSVAAILSQPMPHRAGDWLTRCLIRSTLLAGRRQILAVRGLEHISPACDPFILALNHSQKLEALLVPALLGFYRGGKLVHFLADWNFKLVPGVAVFYRCGQVITIDRKPARPTFLNVFKPLLTDKVPGFTRARQRLEAGASVGIFPEGTVNPHPRQLLTGHTGAARLSLETGVPLVPAGIRFPRVAAGQPVGALAPLVLEIGAPLLPPRCPGQPAPAVVRQWHERLMQELARLSQKEWQPHNPRKNPCH